MVTVRMSLVRRDGATAAALSLDYHAGLVAEIKASCLPAHRWWDKELKVWFVDSRRADEVVARLEAFGGGRVVQVRRDANLGRKIASDWARGGGTPWPKGFGAPSQNTGDAPGGAAAASTGAGPGRTANAQPGANGAARGAAGGRRDPKAAPPPCDCGWHTGKTHTPACSRYADFRATFGWACAGCLATRRAVCFARCPVACRCEQWRLDKNQHADGCPRNPVQTPPGPKFHGFEEFFRTAGFRPFRVEFNSWSGGGQSEPPPPSRRVRFATEDDYRILGLQPGATAEEVKAAHRRLALKNHPDRGGDGEVLKAVNAAVDRIRSTMGASP